MKYTSLARLAKRRNMPVIQSRWAAGLRHTSNSAQPDTGPTSVQQPRFTRILLLGPPGSGKGTYAKKLCAATGLSHLSPGELIRAETRVGTELGNRAAQYTRAGELLPMDLIKAIMAGSMSSYEGGFILDGFPRSLEQAKMLDMVTDLDCVVHITMREDALKAKLQGRRLCPDCGVAYNIANVNLEDGKFVMPPMLPESPRCIANKCIERFEQREDDTLPVIERRLEIYTQETKQLVDHYRPRGVVHDVVIEGGEAVMMPVLKKLLGVQ